MRLVCHVIWLEGGEPSAMLTENISRDGMLSGLNLEQTIDLASQISTPVIASGGVGSLDDLTALKAAAECDGPGLIDGVIVGRALYDGRVDPREALALLAA